MDKKYNKNDKFVRMAIYEAYDRKCFYSKEFIKLDELEIDHIIPQSIGKNELDKIISHLGLPHDFNLNSLYNLVPCKSIVNKRKSQRRYTDSTIAHLIFDNTSQKVPMIIKKIEQLKGEDSVDKAEIRLVASIENSKLSQEKRERICDNILGFPVYKEDVIIQDNYFQKSLSNVCLSSFLPKYPNLKGSCLVTFYNLKIRNCMITLNHEDIMGYLFKGVKTDLSSQGRPFILEDRINNGYYVDLSNVRIPLKWGEVKQLVEIIDAFYEEYMKELNRVEEIFKYSQFKKMGNEGNNLILCQVEKDLWMKIVDFCRKYDYLSANSEWHIFDATGSHIQIYDKESNEIRATIFPRISEHRYSIPDKISIDIVWTDTLFHDPILKDFEDSRYWSPIKVQDWIEHQLIPIVNS